MNRYIFDLAQSLMLYLFLGLSYFGWGLAFLRMLRVSEKSISNNSLLIWLGWAFTLLIFQIVHLFLPLTGYVTAPILIVGILVCIKHISKKNPHGHCFKPMDIKLLFALSGLILFAGWIASRAMLSPEDYDAGFYYFNVIRWINSYHIVPGLGNLHGRLAFNQSFFTYTAALNFYPFYNHGRSIANSFLFLLTLTTFVEYLWPIVIKPATLVQSHPFKFLPSLFVLPFLGCLALGTYGFTSPTPDLGSVFLQLVIFVTLLHGIAAWLSGKRNLNAYAVALTLLAATSITVKISNLVFAGIIIVFVLAYTWQLPPPTRGVALGLFLPAFLVVLVWVLRGFLLSGVPLYPSTFGYIPVDWAVPKNLMVIEKNWIYSWARQPGDNWKEVLGNWEWFEPWVERTFQESIAVYYPLCTTGLFGILYCVLLAFKKLKRPHFLEWVMLFPILFALIFWFFTAPDPRFALALFLLLAVSTMVLFLSLIYNSGSPGVYAIVLVVVFLIGNFYYVDYAIQNINTIRWVSDTGYQSIPEVPLEKMETKSGLEVLTPKTDDKCWDAPLPCTPYFDTRLTLREPGNFASGFMVDD